MSINIKEVVQNSLSSRLKISLEGKTNELREENILMFKKHTTFLSDFIQKEYLDKGFLSVDFFQGLHRLFYPSGYIIKATGNDNIEVENFPGEWRKQKLSPYITDFSKNENIPENLARLISDFNSLQEKTRESILEFYMKFGEIHPFGDSNGTVSAIIADVQCTLYGFKPLNYLHIRFRDKDFLFHTIQLYIQDSSKQGLEKIIREIDTFHDLGNYPSFSDICTRL